MKNAITIKMVDQLCSIFKVDQKGEDFADQHVMHCTNPECQRFYHDDPDDMEWLKEHGSYKTAAFGEVPRYRCTSCGKTFSDQSFALDYYVKKPVKYVPLMRALVSTSGQSNLGRFENMRVEQIQNRYERLSRMLLAVHGDLRNLLPKQEDFVLDGFESFSRSQYYPNNINIIAGKKSEYIYSMGYAQLRRKGRMTEQQKQKREEEEKRYGRAPRKAIEMSVAKLLYDLRNFMQDKQIGKRILYTDEHKAYPRALNRVPDSDLYFKHITVSSKQIRNFQNPMFPANYFDRQARKDSINHVRETIQFARCPSAMMLRLTIYQMYHNYFMPRRVREQRKGNWETRAEYMGISKSKILSVIRKHWNRRPFYHLSNLWNEEKKTWLMLWKNSRIKIGRRIPMYIMDYKK